jgi:hypothetical protein
MAMADIRILSAEDAEHDDSVVLFCFMTGLLALGEIRSCLVASLTALVFSPRILVGVSPESRLDAITT